MGNTYTQIYVHVVFGTKGRHALIPEAHLAELFGFSAGILQRRSQKVIIVGGMPDHMHVAIGLNPSTALSDVVRDLKAGSSGFVNRSKWIRGRFEWQSGYGAFSFSRSQMESVYDYIANQKLHHEHRSFRDEYISLLNKYGVDFDNRYV